MLTLGWFGLLKGGVQAGLVACMGGEEPETPFSQRFWLESAADFLALKVTSLHSLPSLVTESGKCILKNRHPPLLSIPSCFSSECLIAFFFFLVRLYHWTFIDRNQIVVIWAKRRLFRRLHRGVVPRNETGSPTTAEPVLSSRNLPSFNIANI